MLINPGSRIEEPPKATWTNTYEVAEASAHRWLKSMHDDDGLRDVELVKSDPVADEGRWSFTFRHRVTGVEAVLSTHGINDVEAYCKRAVFTPRIYWNGCSSSNPKLDDFAAPGFQKLATFTKAASI